MFPKKAMHKQGEAAAGAANDNSQTRIVIENAAGDHTQRALRYLGIGKDGERDPRSSIFEPFQRWVFGKTGAVQKDGPLQFGSLGATRRYLRQVHNHFA